MRKFDFFFVCFTMILKNIHKKTRIKNIHYKIIILNEIEIAYNLKIFIIK